MNEAGEETARCIEPRKQEDYLVSLKLTVLPAMKTHTWHTKNQDTDLFAP